MLILHQLHRVPDDKIGTFEATVRDSLLPSQKDEPARLFWYAEALPDSFGGSEIATMTMIDNPGGLALVGAESGSAVAEVLTELRSLRSGVENRLTRFLTFSPVREELDNGPSWPEEPAMYLHDFVTPQRGHFDEYDRELDTTYRKLLTLELGPSSKVWSALQVIPGGGTARECVIISRVADQARFAVPIVRGLPENLPGPLGEWMRVAKKLRDTWTSRLVLAPAWSPLR